MRLAYNGFKISPIIHRRNTALDQFITEELLLSRGIDLDGEDVEALLVHLNDMLEEHVSSEITESLDDTQVTTLVELQEKASDEEIGTWLTQHVPEFELIVQTGIDSIIKEVTEDVNK